MNNFYKFTNKKKFYTKKSINLKTIKNIFIFSFMSLFIFSYLIFTNQFFLNKKNSCTAITYNNETPYKMAIVIDDFGSWEQAGVQKILNCGETITCAVLPNVDNTENNLNEIQKYNHEIILHMPMESHVNLNKEWYGPIYIQKTDNKDTIYKKINNCLSQFPNIKGFNIHIGSGISQNKELMKHIYNYAKENDLYFLDSRTIITDAVEKACEETNSIYLGRDVFLEADKNKSYKGVCNRLIEGAYIARDKGYSIVIGHVGAEGGENTARAICDTLPELKKMGVEIVPLSSIYNLIKNK